MEIGEIVDTPNGEGTIIKIEDDLVLVNINDRKEYIEKCKIEVLK